MNEKQTLQQKLSGYALLAIIAFLFLLGRQTGLVGGLVNEIDASSTAEGTITAIQNTPILEDDLTEPLALVDIPIVDDQSLVPAPVPNTYQGQQPQHNFEIYVVKRGDTPNGIAESFGISPETLLGGNPRLSQESSLLQTDVELIILPINGVLHDVQPGDTLESLSLQYGIPTADIIAYEPNNLQFPYRLYPNTQILVPGAVREVFVWTPPDLSSVTSNSSYEGRGVAPIVVGTGSFIFPVSTRNFTQRYWYGHQAIDVGLAEGSAVYAADTGTVTYASWNVYGYGNLIVVNHGNGFETFYAHLSGINVVPGQIVYKGNVIGASGNTGRSSGPHLHFEIRLNNNRDDPCWYLGC